MDTAPEITSRAISEIASVFYKDLTGIYDWCHKTPKKENSISEIDRYNFILGLYDTLRVSGNILKERESGEEVSEKAKDLLKSAQKKIERFEEEKKKKKEVSQKETLEDVLKNTGLALGRKIEEKLNEVELREEEKNISDNFSEEEIIQKITGKMSEEILIAKAEMENSKGFFKRIFESFLKKK